MKRLLIAGSLTLVVASALVACSDGGRCIEGPACSSSVQLTFTPPQDFTRTRVEVVLDDGRTLRCGPGDTNDEPNLLQKRAFLGDGGFALEGLSIYATPSMLEVRVLRDDQLVGDASFRPEYRDYKSSPTCACRSGTAAMMIANKESDGK